MRAVVQRVSQASVASNGKETGAINKGYFVLLGVREDDTEEKAKQMAFKLTNLRVMADDQGKINKTLKDTSGSLLLVSQFTLYADTKNGNRPSFIKAAEPKLAKKLYNTVLAELTSAGIKVEKGSFGNHMTIVAGLDGPVTIILEI